VGDDPYREPVPRPRPHDPYLAASTKYRRRRLWTWGALFVSPVAAWVALSMVGRTTGASQGAVVLLYAIPVCLAVFAIANALAGVGGAFPCTRCGKRWEGRSNPLSRQCLACDIEIETGTLTAPASPPDPP
jgi:hypothetical protein